MLQFRDYIRPRFPILEPKIKTSDTSMHFDQRKTPNTAIPEERLTKGLAALYKKNPKSAAVIAELCDEHLDRTGRLLGEIRIKALNL